MTDITTLLDLMAGHQWAMLSASVLMISLAIGRRMAPLVWTKIPAWARPVPLLLAAGIPEYVAQIQLGVAWPFAALYALMFGLGAIGVIGAVGGTVKRKDINEKARAERLTRADKTTPVAVGLLLMVLGLPSCAASLEEAKLAGLDPQARAASVPPSERCQSLDSQRRTWGAIGKGAGVLAGASGLAAIPVDDKTARIGLAAGTVAAGTVAIVGIWVSEDAGDAWVRECGQP